METVIPVGSESGLVGRGEMMVSVLGAGAANAGLALLGVAAGSTAPAIMALVGTVVYAVAQVARAWIDRDGKRWRLRCAEIERQLAEAKREARRLRDTH